MVTESAGETIVLDTVDEKLIRELKKDGRSSYARLAPMVGLSQAAVRARVQRLIDSGVISVVAIVNPDVLGIGLTAVVCIEVRGPARDVAADIKGLPEATFIVATAGRYDLLAELQCESQGHLLDTLDAIRTIPGVANVDSLPYLHLVKQNEPGGGIG